MIVANEVFQWFFIFVCVLTLSRPRQKTEGYQQGRSYRPVQPTKPPNVPAPRPPSNPTPAKKRTFMGSACPKCGGKEWTKYRVEFGFNCTNCVNCNYERIT